jgi:hypothetical protein
MAATSHGHLHFIPAVRVRAGLSDYQQAKIEELEFGEEFRNARFPAGWYLLPSAALTVALILIF